VVYVEKPYEPVRLMPSGRERIQLPPSLRHDEAFEFRIYSIVNKTSGRDIENIPKENQCRWIIGDPKDIEAYWCRMDVSPGTHYCAFHYKLSYQPFKPYVRKKKEKHPDVRPLITKHSKDEAY
jgi:hypothetical protein